MKLHVYAIKFTSILVPIVVLCALILIGRAGIAGDSATPQRSTESGAPVTLAGRQTVNQTDTPVLLLLHTDTLVVLAETGTTTITAQILDVEGNPLPGIEVYFQTREGTITPASASTNTSGIATATYTAGGTPGQVIISAESYGLSQQTALQIVQSGRDATSYTLTLETATEKAEPGQQVPGSAILRDGRGQPVAGELISFFGSLGAVIPTSALTDNNGRVSITYRAGTIAGEARITGLAGYASASTVLTVASPTTATPTATVTPTGTLTTPTTPTTPTATPSATPTVTVTPIVTAEPADHLPIYLPLITGGR